MHEIERARDHCDRESYDHRRFAAFRVFRATVVIGQIARSQTIAPRANVRKDKNSSIEQGLNLRFFSAEIYEGNRALFAMRASSLERPTKRIYSVCLDSS